MMDKILITCMICSFCIGLKGQNLEKHLWKHRVVLIKSPLHDQTQVKDLIDDVDALMDRKLVVYQFYGTTFTLIDHNQVPGKRTGQVSSEASLHFSDVGNEFELVLIGLDGGVKMRKTKMVSKDEIFALIDGMPMRKAELNNRNKMN